jgi:hypothetical protein
LETELNNYKRLVSSQIFGNELHLVVSEASAEDIIKTLAEKFKAMGFCFQKIIPGMEDVFLSYMKQAESSIDK